jgi:hypothetical protein
MSLPHSPPVDTAPLSVRQAAELDAQIKAAVVAATTSIDTLLELLKHAIAGQAHAALGDPTITAYLCKRIAPRNRRRLHTVISNLQTIADTLGGGS